jgi:hypothetical protein
MGFGTFEILSMIISLLDEQKERFRVRASTSGL